MACGGAWWASLLVRSLAFLGVWYVLTRGELSSLPYGLPVSIAAAVIHGRLAPASGRVGWLDLAMVVPRFLQLIFLGGADVAIRALRPRLPINPGFLEHALPDPGSRYGVATSYILSLQPGTLVVRFQENGLLLHAINLDSPVLWLTHQDTNDRLKRALLQETGANDRI